MGLRERIVRLIEEDHFDKAIFFARILKRNPEDRVWAYHQLGLAHLLKGEYGNAIPCFSNVIYGCEQSPSFRFQDWEEAYSFRSLAYHRLGKKPEAKADLDRAPYHPLVSMLVQDTIK